MDQSVFLWLNFEPDTPSALVWLAKACSQWLPVVLLAALVPLAVGGSARTQRTVLLTVLSMALAWALAALGKHHIVAPRPFMLGLGTEWLGHSRGNGFPSAHATVATAYAVAMAWGLWRWPWRAAALLCGLLVGLSRIALGVHFPSDVLAATVLGALCAWLLHAVAGRVWPVVAPAPS